jgi:hypothetical protein
MTAGDQKEESRALAHRRIDAATTLWQRMQARSGPGCSGWETMRPSQNDFKVRAGGKEAVGNAAAPAVGSLRSARKQ